MTTASGAVPAFCFLLSAVCFLSSLSTLPTPRRPRPASAVHFSIPFPRPVHLPFRRRQAFSLIELLAVLLVLGVLVALAIPKFSSYKRKAQIATMVSDLRNLAVAEEGFWNVVNSYTADTAALELTTSPGVTVTMVSADSTGWSARATHRSETTVCSIFYGNAPALPPAEEGNVIGCSK